MSFIYSQVEEPNENSADTTVKRELSLNAYPYIYYTPETELAFGAGGILIFYTSQSPVTLPSKLVLGGYYSTKKQYKITLDPTFYFLDNNLFINLPLSYGYFVDRFYGIGPTSTDVGDENYTSRVYTATLFLQIPSYWFTSDRTGLILDFNYTEMVDKQTNQELVNNSVVGSNGGSSVGIGVQAVWDSRDNLFFPNEGKYSSLKFLSYPIGDFNFYMFELDIRHYSSFSKDHILAGQAYFNSAGGSIPFYKVPALGGQNRMRGYYFGRYRDNVYYTFQLEYRQYFWWRFGYVLFGGIGGVASSPDKLRIDEFQFSYGAGLRYLFNKDQKVNVRVDFGIGSNGSTGIYFGIEEAF
ncbi:MAG: outer membrane protein assembly factor [Ignavibacteriaceae bacterium]|nr:outer membrane protein assembly factor [Ignavibacteriaceae bacterium]